MERLLYPHRGGGGTAAPRGRRHPGCKAFASQEGLRLSDRRTAEREALERERGEILAQLDEWLELPLLLLGLAWLALLVVDLVQGLTPALDAAVTAIWAVFVADFLFRLLLAPRKLAYLRSNWLTVLALALPALRALRFVRVLRAARAVRGLRLARLVTSLNRGMRALRATMRRRGAGYVAAFSLAVALVGAAGMYAFESPAEGGKLASYGDALWWTAMLLTTLGSEKWPQTPEGRILCFLLALYAFAVFGYLTAALASYFIGRDAEDAEAALASARALRELRGEIEALREEVRGLRGGP